MSKIGLALILILMTGRVCAQDYFILIQADNRHAFYVRMGGQFYPSSSEGHLILSHLKDSTYGVAIGFSGSSMPELYFNINIPQKDQAFLIRQDQGESGWNLYNSQSEQVLKPQPPGNEVSDNAFRPFGVKKEDAFSLMMAGVVRDTLVLYDSYAQTTPPPVPPQSAVAANVNAAADTSTPVAVVSNSKDSTTRDSTIALAAPAGGASSDGHSIDSSMSSSSSSIVPGVAASPDSVAGEAKHTAVSADSSLAGPTKPVADSVSAAPASDSVSAAPATAAVSSDVANHKADTTTSVLASNAPAAGISGTADPVKAPLYRPITTVAKLSEKKLTHSVRQVYTDRSSGKKTDTIVVIIPVDSPAVAGRTEAGPAAATPLYRPVSGPNATGAATGVTGRIADTNKRTAKPSIKLENSDCHAYATDYDVDKLRVKLLGGATDDDRIAVLRKMFKIKCFSSPQLRALSEVFTGDAAKFHFLETAYPYCSDGNFRELAGLLSDPVYTNKFRAMTNQ